MRGLRPAGGSRVFKVAAVIVLGFCALIGVTVYYTFRSGCLPWECAPTRNFTVYDLSIPANLLPPGAEPIVLYPDRGTLGTTEEARGVSSHVAVYTQTRFATIAEAKAWYQQRLGGTLFTRPLEDRGLYSRVLNYHDTVADQYFIDCGYIVDDPSCIFMARYQEFCVFFNGSMRVNRFTQEQFVSVLSYLDNMMKAKLQGST